MLFKIIFLVFLKFKLHPTEVEINALVVDPVSIKPNHLHSTGYAARPDGKCRKQKHRFGLASRFAIYFLKYIK